MSHQFFCVPVLLLDFDPLRKPPHGSIGCFRAALTIRDMRFGLVRSEVVKLYYLKSAVTIILCNNSIW